MSISLKKFYEKYTKILIIILVFGSFSGSNAQRDTWDWTRKKIVRIKNNLWVNEIIMKNEEHKTEGVAQEKSQIDSLDNNPIEKNKDGAVGPIIGSIIVIILIILGGIYYWNSTVSNELQKADVVPIQNEESVEDIRANLESEISNLDMELEEIEAEIQAEFEAELNI